MKRRGKHSDPRNLIDDFRNWQSNITWPDAQINSRSVDAYLWKGNPKAPLIQRIGAMLFGLVFLGFGSMSLGYARRVQGFFDTVVLIGWCSALLGVGGRLCYSALRRE